MLVCSQQKLATPWPRHSLVVEDFNTIRNNIYEWAHFSFAWLVALDKRIQTYAVGLETNQLAAAPKPQLSVAFY